MAAQYDPPTQSLLSLLNFGQAQTNGSSNSARPEHAQRAVSENSRVETAKAQHTTMSASDLVATFMSAQSTPPTKQNRIGSPDGDDDGSSGGTVNNPTPSDSRDALLRLLHRTTSGVARSSQAAATGRETSGSFQVNALDETRLENAGDSSLPVSADIPQRRSSPIRLFGSSQSREVTPFEAPKLDTPIEQKENKPLFTYQNPFEALNASRHQSPKPEAMEDRTTTPKPSVESNAQQHDLTTEGRISTRHSPDPVSARKKLTPRLPGRSSSTNAKVMEDLLPQDRADELPLATIEVIPEEALKSDRADALRRPAEAASSTIQPHLPPPATDAGNPESKIVEQIYKEVPSAGAETWESADNAHEKQTQQKVPVYNFPIKPFVAITIQPGPMSEVGIREDSVMEISRFKKEFDQIDRSLAAATRKYISYALVKNGGLRIIRQDDGSDRQVFKSSHDRVFNISFCSTAMIAPPAEDHAVLGTAVSGSVYYATVTKAGNDLFDKNVLETESLIFPPFPLGDENTSGGVLKTRAKRSSRHPEFFAIGRGKSIHLIWPAYAMSGKFGISASNRRVDMEKLYKERGLKITTGKAGKDFTFSEDDTLIVSLDKAGRLRFWDIRPLLTEADSAPTKITPTNVDLPLLTLSTALAAEKSWPTSVLFVDKVKPYTRCAALRYVLVGFRQNHTLQLWDIALGKAVQELNFPHEAETDGICSVSYHPNSGIIVVGHPTRNSIYFIHLSAPRYTLSPMSQATFIQRLADRDPEFPNPDSTACMSGIREMSFEEKGQLRSVELLPIYKSSGMSKSLTEPQGLFELYVGHSRGVTCLTVSKEDLGWDAESKVIDPINAAAEGFITLKELGSSSVLDQRAESKPQLEGVQQSPNAPKKKSPSKFARPTESSTTKSVEAASEDTGAPRPEAVSLELISKSAIPDETLVSKATKRNNKKKSSTTPDFLNGKGSSSNDREISPAKQLPERVKPTLNEEPQIMSAAIPNLHLTQDEASEAKAIKSGISGEWLDNELKRIESGVSAEFRRELSTLYQNIQNDRTVQDSTAVARHEAVLRLVSSTLSTNIEKSLSRMISTQIQQAVVPAITGITVQAVTSQIGEAVARTLHQLVPHELSIQMPVAINTALQNPQISRNISDSVGSKITMQLETHIADAVHKTITPSVEAIAIAAAEKSASEVEIRLANQVRQLEADRRMDEVKIDKLGQVLQEMAETMQGIAELQVAIQGQILKDWRSTPYISGVTALEPLQVSTARRPQPTVFRALGGTDSKDIELEEISSLMSDGKYEEGSIKWLQSTQSVELFDRLFVRYTPEYLSTDVSPLVAFSVAITIANSLSTNLARRIEWMDAAFAAVDIRDSEIADLSEHAPSLLNSVIQKLDALQNDIGQENPNDQTLRTIPRVISKAQSMKAALMGQSQNRAGGMGNHRG